MRFWDSSALLAVLGVEDRGRELALLLDEDPEGMIWVLIRLEPLTRSSGPWAARCPHPRLPSR